MKRNGVRPATMTRTATTARISRKTAPLILPGCPENAGAQTPTCVRRAGGAPALRTVDSARGDVLRVLARAGRELLAVVPAALTHGLLRARGGLLSHLAAAVDGLLRGLLDLLRDVVGEAAELLILDARGREEHPDDQTCAQGAERQPDGVLLRDADGALRALLDVAGVGRGRRDAAREPVLGVGHLAREPVLGLGHLVLRAALDVGLVAEGVHGVSHVGPGGLYLPADLVRVFAHSTSSFTVSTVCSGTGGAASRSRLRPASATTAAIAR